MYTISGAHGEARDVKPSPALRNRPPAPASASTRQPYIDPNKCTIKFHAFNSCTVQTVDSTGKKMTTGGAKVEATRNAYGSLTVQDNNNGTYTFGYSRLGGLIHVKISGTPIKGSPFNPFNHPEHLI